MMKMRNRRESVENDESFTSYLCLKKVDKVYLCLKMTKVSQMTEVRIKTFRFDVTP